MHKIVLAAAMAGLLAACSTQHNGTVEKVVIDDKVAGLVTGSDRRLVSSTTIGVASRPGRVDPHLILCVEPSPDVAVAVAEQVGSALSLLGKGSGSTSSSQSEGLVQLAERTTTLQAILNQGYQACLDYSNGAITATTYALRQSRLDDLIGTLVISEHASGAFGRSGAAIATSADGMAHAAVSDLAAGSAGRDHLRENLKEIQTEIVEKQKQRDDINNEISAAKERGEDTVSLTTILGNRESELTDLYAQRKTIRQLLTTTGESLVRSVAEVNSAIGHGGLTSTPNFKVAQVLGAMQERFLNPYSDRAFVSICLTELGLWSKLDLPIDTQIKDYFLKRITSTKPNSKVTYEDLQIFFLGRQIGNQTLLSEFCQKHLPQFLEWSVTNRHDLQRTRLEIDAKRHDANIHTGAPPSQIYFEHPLAVYNQLKDAEQKLKNRKADLEQARVSDPSKVSEDILQTLKTSKEDLLKQVNGIMSKVNAAVAAKGIIDEMENDYIRLVADTRRATTGSANDLWRAEFNLLRVKAHLKTTELKELVEKMTVLDSQSDQLIVRIRTAG